MEFTYINKLNKTSYSMKIADVITHFKLNDYTGNKLNDVINSVKNWITIDSKTWALYRLN